MKKSTLLVALLAVFSAAALLAFLWLFGKVRAYEREHQVSIICGAKPVDLSSLKPPPERIRSVDQPLTSAKPTDGVASSKPIAFGVSNVVYSGDTELRIKLTDRPDMSAIRQYVSVEPLASGFIAIAYEAVYNYQTDNYEPTLVVTGDFAHRTNVTLRIRRGLARYGQQANPHAKDSFAEDFTYTFKRKDLDPYVSFADRGRYLPPSGRRTIGIESVNVESVQTEVRRVEPHNVVQLLAREERVYDSYYGGGGDTDDTLELSGDKVEKSIAKCKNLPNAKEVLRLPVAVADGRSRNGIFLVTVGDGSKPFCSEEYHYVNDQWVHRGDWYNPAKYRLVCVSDLGLSVRRSANDGLLVWVTSLLKGSGIGGAAVEVYSKKNVKVMSGVTDSRGLVRPIRRAEGDPFAIVVRSASGDDMTFLALSDRAKLDENFKDGQKRPAYLAENESTGFAWTERGIYRHDEKIYFEMLLRNGKMTAPKPFPVTLRLENPNGAVYAEKTAMPDERGALAYEDFSVPAEQPSGLWRIAAYLPGKDGAQLAAADFKIEEFAPPQVRVTVTAMENVHPTNFAFTVAAEHLFGGAAAELPVEGAVVFEDVPFAPAAWKGYTFGCEDRALKPCFRRLKEIKLDAEGRARFEAPIWGNAGLPRAMVRATGQGTVFEDGGRPATGRASTLLHYYPYYIGSTMTSWLRLPEQGTPEIALALVTPDGARLKTEKRLFVKLERVDSVYSYREGYHGVTTWSCEHIRSTLAEGVEIKTRVNDDTVFPLPMKECGDYVITVTDPETGVAFGRTFYLSAWGDETVRAPLANPTEVTIRADKSFYRVGETPRLIVKSPFAGEALLSVMREKELYTEAVTLTNATSEISLRTISSSAEAPSLNVFISVIQSVEANAKRLALRAHGQTTIRVRPIEQEIPVELAAEVHTKAGGGSTVEVSVGVSPTTSLHFQNAVATVTVVDEGINLLTGEKTPDPIAAFARPRLGVHPIYDLFGKVLPVDGDDLRIGGIKTGGDFGAEMLGRVSPVGTRRFKPLALWQKDIPLGVDPTKVTFELPEFVGEVRITAVVHSPDAAGAAAIHRKVAPKLVMMPDAPRFAAPGDTFGYVLPLYNRSGADGKVEVRVSLDGRELMTTNVALVADGSLKLAGLTSAPDAIGEVALRFEANGFGESHAETILLPVRPAVPWIESCGVTPKAEWRPPTDGRCSTRIYDSPVGEYAAAIRWLAEYPHGCLEQTASRVFPLIAAEGALAGVVSNGMEIATAGVRRIESMIREYDFVMWPDCSTEPWNREVSIYASELLLTADRAGIPLRPVAREQVLKFLKKWARSDTDEISVYATMTLAEAGKPDKDRLFRLYDVRKGLSALARARLALGFAAIRDMTRAKALLADAYDPQSVKEAAFRTLALLAIDPDDERILSLVTWLNARRDRAKLSWGTTEENAHALRAIGAYFRAHPPKPCEKFVAWRKLTLPKPEEIRDESEGLSITRVYRTTDGRLADLRNLKTGELLIAELSIVSPTERFVNDLVIEDLFAGAFDPVHREITPNGDLPDWILRKDVRDDRILIYSKKFTLEAGCAVKCAYPVRVVSAGDYILPGPSVEGMYDPRLHARRVPDRIVVHD